jgi:hypothetical protein
MVIVLRHVSTLKTLEALSLYEILDFKGRKKYSESIFLRCLFNATREVMHDGPKL